MPPDHKVYLTPSPHALFQELDGEMLLMSLETERYYGLDDVGTRFWQLLTTHEDLDQIVALLREEFDVEEPVLRADISTLIAELDAAGLIARQ